MGTDQEHFETKEHVTLRIDSVLPRMDVGIVAATFKHTCA